MARAVSAPGATENPSSSYCRCATTSRNADQKPASSSARSWLRAVSRTRSLRVERLLRHPAVVVEPHEPAHRDLLGEQERERRQGPDQQRRDAFAGNLHRRLPLPQVALGKEPVRNLARERQFLEHDLRHVAGLMVEHPHP